MLVISSISSGGSFSWTLPVDYVYIFSLENEDHEAICQPIAFCIICMNDGVNKLAFTLFIKHWSSICYLNFRASSMQCYKLCHFYNLKSNVKNLTTKISYTCLNAYLVIIWNQGYNLKPKLHLCIHVPSSSNRKWHALCEL